MAPIRRYLRITKYSVIECRIYLDNPGLVHTWLLSPRTSILPRVIESVRPYVLPKLREERERSRKRSTKKKGIKDVVIEDDFEVSVFLTETSTRHTLVTKHKHFHDTTQTKLKSNSGRLISEATDAPIGLDMAAESAPVILREESEDEDTAVALADIPAVDEAAPNNETRRPKRTRSNTHADADADSTAGSISGDQNNQVEVISDEDYADEDDDGLFVQSPARESPPAKRRRPASAQIPAENNGEDKKKLTMDISYEGFSIYGRVLCLVVKRRDGGGADRAERNANVSAPSVGGSGNNRAKAASRGRGQAMMEDFIISTQIPAGTDVS
ncbi:hypothetical protein F5B22DRAFT_285681 [Xylaria bambusicola]|uniref:uncharacterized protein n=1 Tax=Xylaria bambusicola TaxID=326684 RepID=UPI002007616A|nr:uncharacterized protein F5B22DRAFT_285681 [Xylaria bambusicola]KAI0513068.1 hypothetical protein F5B22DRAFT_285681 [Xylaria bambusicola]